RCGGREEQHRRAGRGAVGEEWAARGWPRLRHRRARPGSAPAGNGAVSLEQIAERAFKRTRKAMKALSRNPTDDELHQVRIEVKRARYAGELAEPVLGKAGARFIRAAKDVQGVIGDHPDAFVPELRMRELAASGRAARSALVAGRLIERQRLRKKAARKALPAAWRAFEKAGRAAFS